MTQKTRKPVYRACLSNLRQYLRGEVTFDEWLCRQEELESRLTPEPELPFDAERDEGQALRPERPKAA